MFEEVKKAIGANWFRAFVVAFGCLWVWHSFFSSVAEVGTARNVTAQGDNAADRERAIRERAVADAEIQQAIAREALRRQKAEADEAEARAVKTKAEACSARLLAAAQGRSPNQLGVGNEALRDCNPAYQARAKPDEQKDKDMFIINTTYLKASEKFDAGKYVEAVELAQKYVAASEDFDFKYEGGRREMTADALRLYAWYLLFLRNYTDALVSAERALKLNPYADFPERSRAHALMFLGNTKEAKDGYLAYNRKNRGSLGLLGDFDLLRKADSTHPLMAEIEAAIR